MEHIGRECRQVGLWTRPGGDWPSEAYRRIYQRELTARLPDVRMHFIGDLPDAAVAVSESGDLMTSLAAAGEDGRALTRLVAAAPDAADLAALGRGLERAPSPPMLILSALSVGEASRAQRESLAAIITPALDVTVRDARSRDHAQAIGSREIAFVPDPLFLATRLTAPGVNRSRIEYLMTMDRYPMVETLLVEVSPNETRHLATVGQHLKDAIARGYRLVAVAVPMNGEAMTEELRRCVAAAVEPAHCVDRLNLEDRLAIVATATAVVPLSASLLAAACAFGRPAFWWPGAEWNRAAFIDGAPRGVCDLIHDDFAAMLKTPSNPSAADSWRAQLDSQFDRMARLLSSQVDEPGPRTSDPLRKPAAGASRISQLEETQRMTGRRLADERLRFAGRAEGLRTEIEQLKHDIARRTAVEAALRQEMADALAHARLEVSRADSIRQAAEAAHRQLQADISILQREKAELTAAVTGLSHESAARAEAVAALSRENADRAAYIDALTRERDELLAAVRRFARSKSWRYLAPARTVAQTLRRWLSLTR